MLKVNHEYSDIMHIELDNHTTTIIRMPVDKPRKFFAINTQFETVKPGTHFHLK